MCSVIFPSVAKCQKDTVEVLFEPKPEPVGVAPPTSAKEKEGEEECCLQSAAANRKKKEKEKEKYRKAVVENPEKKKY